MYNLLIALGAGVAAFLVFFLSGLPVWGALMPATLALVGAYFVLARRTLRQLQAIMVSAQGDLMGKRVDAGLEKLKQGFPLAKWQFLVAPQVHAQLGMVLYMMSRDDEALPHLEKSYARIGQARAMLGALKYRRKDLAGAQKVFEEAARYNKKDGFVWSIYAWCLNDAGQRDKALAVMARAIAASPGDEKLKENQKRLQNNQRMSMKAYGNEWWAYRLERPPAELAQAMAPAMQRKGYRPGYRPRS